MSWLMQFLLVWLVTAVSLLIISRLRVGVEVVDVKTAVIGGLTLGLLNAFVRPVLAFLTWPINFITLGAFSIVINAIIFGLAAGLVEGFNLRKGCLTALIGAILLGLLNGLILWVVT